MNKLLFINCLLTLSSNLYAISSRFSANQSGNIIQLSSPYGSKIYMGDLGFDRMPSYRFEVLLKDLKPPSFGGSDGVSDSRNQAEKQANLIEDDEKLIYEANRLYNLGKFHESLSFIEELLRRNPKSVRGWTMKGSLYHILKQNDFAKKAYSEALKLEPENNELIKILENYQ